MGTERKNLRYIGTMDKDWKVIHFVSSDAVSRAPMLRGLQKF